ncbi:MAG TPA: DUF896 domain-containing protein [Syntrophomonas sp.]|nr:DUF896 domain-containing protein [Syntrophomonas sp.]
MITKELVERINELASKKKSQGLTFAEQAEQKRLYKIYLASIREQVKTQLDTIEVVPEGHVCDDTCHHHHHGPGCSHDHHQHGSDGNYKKH